MLSIYIARHGQNEDNVNGILNGHRDLPLTELGIEQAHQLADGIKEAGITFDAIYTSPLSRASKTAHIVAETIGAPEPEVLDDLIERDFGVMSGKSIADIEKLCAPDIIKTDTITYFLAPDGGETFPQLLARANRALKELQARHSDGSILAVCHGDLGKMLYAAYYGLDWQEVLTKFHFGNAELLLLDDDPHTSHVIEIEQHNA